MDLKLILLKCTDIVEHCVTGIRCHSSYNLHMNKHLNVCRHFNGYLHKRKLNTVCVHRWTHRLRTHTRWHIDENLKTHILMYFCALAVTRTGLPWRWMTWWLFSATTVDSLYVCVRILYTSLLLCVGCILLWLNSIFYYRFYAFSTPKANLRKATVYV